MGGATRRFKVQEGLQFSLFHVSYVVMYLEITMYHIIFVGSLQT